MSYKLILTKIFIFCGIVCIQAQNDVYQLIENRAAAIEDEVIAWRRYIHENPELSNREFKTAEYVSTHLKSFGIKVDTGIAHTGVIGVLEGKLPGPTIGLRADMDALPVFERTDVPYKSRVTAMYNGEEVPVMHACGHDTHVAILLGTAKVLSEMKDQIQGKVVFVFQPAEEGAPEGEEGGAYLMVKEGIIDRYGIEAMFGLHINSQTDVGKIRYKSGATMASADEFKIVVKGKQTHGSRPWSGVDPVVVSANIIQGLQQVVSRQSDLTKAPVVITVGKISGGVRMNIIPEEVEMLGTIRTLDPKTQPLVHSRMKRMVESIANASGAEAELKIKTATLVTYNDKKLTHAILPTLKRVAGEENVVESEWTTGAEDFSYFAMEVPSVFFFLGGKPKDIAVADAAPHHTPDFYIDDSELDLGVKAFCNIVIDYPKIDNATKR